MTRPNFEPVLNTAEVHTIEHLGATFLRNDWVCALFKSTDANEFVVINIQKTKNNNLDVKCFTIISLLCVDNILLIVFYQELFV